MLQLATVRPSTSFYRRFSLLMVRSLGFGSNNWYYMVALFRLAFTVPHAKWLKQAPIINSLDRSTKSTQSPDKPAPTPCTHTISGSISLPFRGSFRLSLTVLVLYRSQIIFSLGTWSSRIQSEFLVFRPTRQCNDKVASLGIPGYHRLWRSFPAASTRSAFCNLM